MNNASESFETILDRCITGIRAGKLSIQDCLDAYPQYREELSSLLAVSDQLNRVPKVKASDEFRATALARFRDSNLQTQKVHTSPYPVDGRNIDHNNHSRVIPGTLGSPNHSKKPLPQRSYYFTIALVIFFVIILITSGVALAANSSNPGGTFYPTKLALENLQFNLTKSDLARQQLNIEYATRRLAEVDWLVKHGNQIYVAQPLTNYLEHVSDLNRYLNSADIQDQNRVIVADMVLSSPAMQEKFLNQYYQSIPPELRAEIVPALESARQARQDAQTVLAGFPEIREQIRQLLIATLEAKATDSQGTVIAGSLATATDTSIPFWITPTGEIGTVDPTEFANLVGATADPYRFATLYPSLIPFLDELATRFPTLYPTFSNLATQYPTIIGTPWADLRPTIDRATRQIPRDEPTRRATIPVVPTR